MSVKTEMQQFAQDNGLKFDEEAKLMYGRVNGHNVCLYPVDSSTYRMKIAFSAARSGEHVGDEEAKAFVKGTKNILDCDRDGSRIVFESAGGTGIKKSYEKAKLAMEEAALFLSTNGYADCCEQCGTDSGIGAYYINGEGYHMCDNCFNVSVEAMSQNQKAISKKKGSVIGGIVGALLGSLIGVAAIVIIGQLGYVAAISGIVMGVCTLKGYEILGGKLDKVGIAISCVFMLLMVYVGNNLDWALFIVSEFEGVGIIEAFRDIIWLVTEDILPADSYIMNLLMVYAFTVLGAFPTIKNAARVKSGKYVARRAV